MTAFGTRNWVLSMRSATSAGTRRGFLIGDRQKKGVKGTQTGRMVLVIWAIPLKTWGEFGCGREVTVWRSIL